MAAYLTEEIVGYNYGNKMAHCDCIDDDDIEDQTGIITQAMIDQGDTRYFCDVCDKEIK